MRKDTTTHPFMGKLENPPPEVAAAGLRAGDTVWGEPATTFHPGELAILTLCTGWSGVRVIVAHTRTHFDLHRSTSPGFVRLPRTEVSACYRVTDARRNERPVKLKLSYQRRAVAYFCLERIYSHTEIAHDGLKETLRHNRQRDRFLPMQ
jgi:hypothetical protein